MLKGVINLNNKKNAAFQGWATRANVPCSDGRTIMPNAFAHMDGAVVPLVYQHNHKDVNAVLGHALLEARDGGLYCYAFPNNTPSGRAALESVRHGDMNSFSIYANHLNQDDNRNVYHGEVKEVSLVLAGANPEARIENVAMHHSGMVDILDDEAIIIFGEHLEHSEKEEDEEPEEANEEANEDSTESEKEKSKMTNEVSQNSGSDKTIQDVIDEMTDEQKNVLYFLLDQAANDSEGQNGNGGAAGEDMQHSFKGNNEMTFNAFGGYDEELNVLSHDDMVALMEDAKRSNGTLKNFLQHAEDTHTYGIRNIDVLFPDAQSIRNTPDFYKRRTEWVNAVLNTTNHVPFSRIKSTYADITSDEARAKGYKLDRNNNVRKDSEVFPVLKRTTTPQTIYKTQKLDRDDVLDITDFDVVAWLKQEMRVMLDEEIARAVLIGDGRRSDANDKINEVNVRPIAFDDEVYTIKSIAAKPDETGTEMIDRITTAQVNYQGSGSATMYAAPSIIASLMVLRDQLGNRRYHNRNDLASELGVSDIVEVPVMESVSDTDGNPLKAIIVNLRDYTIGADKGGDVAMFDDFDIDFNQQKYLIETRCSGALTLPKSAIAVFGKKA